MKPSESRFCRNSQSKRKENAQSKSKRDSISSDGIMIQIDVAFAKFKILRLENRLSSEITVILNALDFRILCDLLNQYSPPSTSLSAEGRMFAALYVLL